MINDKRILPTTSTLIARMENGFVGYWIIYQFEKGIGGILTVGMNGSPLSPDFGILKFTDTSESALKNIRYMGFTSSGGGNIGIGVNCAIDKSVDKLAYIQVSLTWADVEARQSSSPIGIEWSWVRILSAELNLNPEKGSQLVCHNQHWLLYS